MQSSRQGTFTPLFPVQEESSARVELLSQVNADQADLVEELSQQVESLRAEAAAAAAAPAVLQLESRVAEADAAAATAAQTASAAHKRAEELEGQVESLQVIPGTSLAIASRNNCVLPDLLYPVTPHRRLKDTY